MVNPEKSFVWMVQNIVIYLYVTVEVYTFQQCDEILNENK